MSAEISFDRNRYNPTETKPPSPEKQTLKKIIEKITNKIELIEMLLGSAKKDITDDIIEDPDEILSDAVELTEDHIRRIKEVLEKKQLDNLNLDNGEIDSIAGALIVINKNVKVIAEATKTNKPEAYLIETEPLSEKKRPERFTSINPESPENKTEPQETISGQIINLLEKIHALFTGASGYETPNTETGKQIINKIERIELLLENIGRDNDSDETPDNLSEEMELIKDSIKIIKENINKDVGSIAEALIVINKNIEKIAKETKMTEERKDYYLIKAK